MCVIVGFTQKTRGREEVLACLDRAYTRGPDMARVAETASGWLGFRRLSIMGLDERGMQPFALGPDKVVCNGELYGWRRQRAELDPLQWGGGRIRCRPGPHWHPAPLLWLRS